ncbi:DUF3617 domain-containing protein [Pseudomonas anguilliseptica]|uniref:DUF3617 domain-containing protein n=1 Tax=Pseudomonas anguilliseptica TaxID=53406 RepID=UPI0022AFFD72|nr:DUF3617 domain-containing protein [Pseudomonas anguilliseptica]MCZ4323766.1 DUF3617 domain-containing protein [Pseudomonas anguilliseptica]
MRRALRNPMLLSLCLLPALASAVDIQPGLWEISSNNMQVGGQAVPGMEQMLEQMKNLPPEQRQMMEQMMAQQGVQLGDKGVRICMSEAQIKAQQIPMQDPDSGCSNEVTERSDQLWKFRFSCPNGEGEGETRFVSDKEFTSTVNGTFDGQSSSMQSHARWVAADCGTLQPQ